MDADAINRAIVIGIQDAAIPRVDRDKVLGAFGSEQGNALADKVSELVHEAVSMPIDRGNKSLQEGVMDMLERFHEPHPDLSADALREIGRCVGWQLR